jgi:mono/diheme cytochrome c family protein
MRSLLIGIVLAPFLTSAALAAGYAEAGHVLATQWCESCHQIEPGAASTKDVAPTFVSLANDHDKNLNWVRNYLLDPHLPMMGISLSRVQIDNVVAYMQTLQRK